MNATATSPCRAPFQEGVWAQFLAFVRRPVLPDRPAGVRAEAWVVLGKLLVLDVLVMVALMGLFSLVLKLGIPTPRSLLENLKLSPALLAFIAIGAPLGEELVFRSWQSGRPGHVVAWVLTVGTLVLSYAAVGNGRSTPRDLAALAVLVLGLGLAIGSLWSRRGRPAMAWFQRHYRWFYFGAAFLFAAAHITNFAGVSPALLPLTLPQFSVGLMLGYLRVRYGLWASALFHIVHNSLFMLLVVASTG